MRLTLRALLCGVLAFSVVASAQMAAATGNGRGGRNPGTQGGTTDTGIYAGASYRGVVFDPPASGEGGSLSPGAGSAWVPPPCYYAPRWKASEFKAFWENEAKPKAGKLDPGNEDTIIEQHEQKYGPDSEYKDHNIDKEDEGSWWGMYINPDSPASDDKTHCEAMTFWVDYSDPPPVLPGVPDAEMLAELAYAQVEIPTPDLELNPRAQAQKVNLDTWVWLDAGALRPVSVTASLDGYAALSSTVTATPVRLRLDPGTADAEVHSGAEGCAVGADGGIGEAWSSARKGQAPPCGVTYLRATPGDGSYALRATLVWEISWQGSDGSGDAPGC
jgi:enoyl reductase